MLEVLKTFNKQSIKLIIAIFMKNSTVFFLRKAIDILVILATGFIVAYLNTHNSFGEVFLNTLLFSVITSIVIRRWNYVLSIFTKSEVGDLVIFLKLPLEIIVDLLMVKTFSFASNLQISDTELSNALGQIILLVLSGYLLIRIIYIMESKLLKKYIFNSDYLSPNPQLYLDSVLNPENRIAAIQKNAVRSEYQETVKLVFVGIEEKIYDVSFSYLPDRIVTFKFVVRPFSHEDEAGLSVTLAHFSILLPRKIHYARSLEK